VNNIKKTGIIVLAAGSSSRLGQPKQLLSYQDKSLLENTIEAAKVAAHNVVVVILGGNYQPVAEHIEKTGVRTIFNAAWEEGISSSIRTGLSGLTEEYNDLDAVVLAVCDQPYMTAGLLQSLIDTANNSDKGIVASSYADTLGTPVLFTSKHFTDLMSLTGQDGAKMLLGKYQDEVVGVPFENGEIDIDTPEDYNRLISGQ